MRQVLTETRRHNIAKRSMSKEARQLTELIAGLRKSLHSIQEQRTNTRLTGAEMGVLDERRNNLQLTIAALDDRLSAVQGLIDLLCQQTIGHYRQEDIGGFYADLELIEVKTIQMINVAHRGFKQRLRRGFAVLFLQIFFQRTGVHADTDGDVFIAGAIHHRTNTLFAADIAGVDTQTIDTVFRHFQRDAVIEVNIGNQRNTHLLLDQFERLGGVHGRHRDANNVRADAF